MSDSHAVIKDLSLDTPIRIAFQGITANKESPQVALHLYIAALTTYISSLSKKDQERAVEQLIHNFLNLMDKRVREKRRETTYPQIYFEFCTATARFVKRSSIPQWVEKLKELDERFGLIQAMRRLIHFAFGYIVDVCARWKILERVGEICGVAAIGFVKAYETYKYQ